MPRRTPGVEPVFLWLWRPSLRSVRAPDLQVVSMAHAVARRGYRVDLVVEGRGSAADLLDWHGLPAVPSLRVYVAPPALASLVHRARIAAFALHRGRRIAVARSPRLARALRAVDPGGAEIVFDVHEVEFSPSDLAIVGASDHLLANAPGTAAAIGARLGRSVPFSQNGTSGCVPWSAPGSGSVYAGSLRGFKDALTLADAARRAGPIDVIGDDGRGSLGVEMRERSAGMLRFHGSASPAEVRRRLGGFGVGLLPVAPGPYADALASPLKLWDYLDAGLPIVAADVPAVRAACAGAPPVHGYVPGDAASLAAALGEARRAPRPARFTRTWDDRAGDLLALLGLP